MLTSLSLCKNQLSGNIPSELAMLTSLNALLLFSNDLTGTIPSDLGYLTTMSFLFVNDNRITGEVPEEVCRMRNNRGGNLVVLVADCGTPDEEESVNCECCTFCA